MIGQITVEDGNICEDPFHAKSQSGLVNGWGVGGAAVSCPPPPPPQHSTLNTVFNCNDTVQWSVVGVIKEILH